MSTFSNPLTEYSPQMETFEQFNNMESVGETAGRVFDEYEEMELAAELLEITNEQELEQFLGDLIRSAGSVLGKIVNSPVGKAIGGVLKSVAGKALPIAGGALGGMFGGPLGAQLGSALASNAGQVLGLELEGLSREDREFEATKQFVRFAADAVRNALEAGPGSDPDAMAHSAAVEAARVHAPGLMTEKSHPRRSSGRWIRRHGKIVLLGV